MDVGVLNRIPEIKSYSFSYCGPFNSNKSKYLQNSINGAIRTT